MSNPGATVTIKFGPFKGFRGVIISTRQSRVLVGIQLRERTVPAELDTNMIERPTKRSHTPRR